MFDDIKIKNLFSKHTEYLIEYNDISKISSIDLDGHINRIFINIRDFEFYKKNSDYKKYSIYFAVFDEKKKEYIDYTTLLNVELNNNNLIINKRKRIIKIINSLNYKQNSSLKFIFTIIPIAKNFKEILYDFEYIFYKNHDKNNYDLFWNKMKSSFVFLLKGLIFILITVFPLAIYAFLIEKAGFVESLIDIGIITNTISHIIFSSLFYFWDNLLIVFILCMVFIPIYIIFILYLNTYLICKLPIAIKKALNNLLCTCKYDYTLEEIEIKRENKSFKNELLYIFTFNFLFKFTLAFLIILLLFINIFILSELINFTKNNKQVSKNSFIKNTAEYYISRSAFPQISKIHIYDKYKKSIILNKTILIMGYDKIFTYYYSIEDVVNILNKNTIALEKYASKNKTISFNKIYKNFIIGNINNSNIKFLKNDSYQIENIDNKLEFKIDIIITDKKINLNI